ncbi:putative metallopeptidase [Sinorhizobium sp. 8-89]|nr:putative metallopeptidase [Sinorhizobium sp. 7-81]MDK1388633.1 putative metallopeptidase [Sinorhizobium sp. 7-81]
MPDWIEATFLYPASPVHNPEHAHLVHAEIGFLWTAVENSRKGRRIIGQCEEGKPQGAMGKWARARAEMQIKQWFGHVPDFIITLDAEYCRECGDAEFMALVEHELYHAAQDVDAFSAPKFSKATGRPVFTIRGHDVEEFVGVVRRYGADAAAVPWSRSQPETRDRQSADRACMRHLPAKGRLVPITRRRERAAGNALDPPRLLRSRGLVPFQSGAR